MVLLLELAAGLSLTVAAALRPVAPPTPAAFPAAPPVAAEAKFAASAPEIRLTDDDRDDPPAPPETRGRVGRPRDVLPTEAVAKIRAAGGKMSGSVSGVGKLLGSHSKTSAHRLLGVLRDMGLIRMVTGPRGVAVALTA
jgi:hypothetical protein